MSLYDFFVNKSSVKHKNTKNFYPVIYISLIVFFVLALVGALRQGDTKPQGIVDWVDVVGEGTVLITSIAWLHLVLNWRPPGRVTLWLALGFSLLSFGFYLDLVDEFIYFNNELWARWLEPTVTPIAIMVLTYSAYLLSIEQQILLRQQRRREWKFRDHESIDNITDLYNANYLRKCLNAEIEKKTPTLLWMIDLDDFDSINQKFGFAIGDKVLNRVAQTLVATVPDSSLVCRYAGDRFVVITHPTRANYKLDKIISNLLTHAVTLALSDQTSTPITSRVHVASISPSPGENAENALQRLCSTIDTVKKE